ncbi:MAG: membrane dipeptidase [Gammaproteobacteria bacterium]|nr:membrane dipeptidase [Gammaproteobacteria bacterium]
MTKEDYSLNPSTQQLIENKLVWDNHSCMPLRSEDHSFLPQLNQFRDAGVDIVSLNVGFDSVSWENTLPMLRSFHEWISEHDEHYMIVSNPEDIETARSLKKIGIHFDIEGASALNGRLEMIETYYNLGVRWMLIAYNQNNIAGGGCQDDDQGLTDFGRDMLDEMERVGMVVCCSHTGFKTTMEVMNYTNNPVIFSHSNPAAMWQHKRNISDEAIKACAATGGVVGVNGIGIFLGDNEATVTNMVRHIDYLVQLVGPDHVGIGLDYVFDRQEVDDFVQNNPDIFPPEDGYADGLEMLTPLAIPAVTQGLVDLGYDNDALCRIMGNNHLRVAEQVWK